MRIDQKKKVRSVAGEHIVIMQDGSDVDMTKVLALNESAMWLYGQLLGQDFSTEDIVRLLMENYEVEEAVAQRDAQEWVAAMKKEGMIVDE